MRICLAVYNHRLAALFDTASRLLLYDALDTALNPAGEVLPPGEGAASRIAAVLACGAEVLVCGALSRCSRQILSDSGLVVWDWVRGDIQDILCAWQEDRLQDMSMPGCLRDMRRAKPWCKRQR